MKLLSIAVPCYNSQDYMEHCVESLLPGGEDVEILIIDDGSKDNTAAIADRLEAEHPGIVRAIHQENAGGGAARNAGLDAARGERIAFVDSDDYIAPDCYQYLHTLLEEGADIAECDFVETESNDAVFGTDAGGISFYTPMEAMRCHIRDTAFRQLIWNKLYRRETVGDIRFPVGTKIDDEFFTYRVLGNAKRLVRSSRKLYAYRQQPDSVMHGGFSLRRL